MNPGFPTIPTFPYSQLRHQIKSGDILLCSGNLSFSKMIEEATQSVWSHVAFILRLDIVDRVMVLESVESIGVRAVTLSSYVKNYNGSGLPYPGRLMLARHQDLKQENIPKLSRFAVDLLGYPYDTQEMIRIASRISMKSVGIKNPVPDPLAQSAFICSEYAYACLNSVGVNVPYDDLGFIAPSDFAKCEKVVPYGFIKTAAVATEVYDRTKLESVVMA